MCIWTHWSPLFLKFYKYVINPPDIYQQGYLYLTDKNDI